MRKETQPPMMIETYREGPNVIIRFRWYRKPPGRGRRKFEEFGQEIELSKDAARGVGMSLIHAAVDGVHSKTVDHGKKVRTEIDVPFSERRSIS